MHGKKHIKRCGVKKIISFLSVQIKFLRFKKIIDEAWGKDVATKPTKTRDLLPGLRDMLCNIISIYHGSLMINLYIADDSWYVYVYIYTNHIRCLPTVRKKISSTMVQSTRSVFLSQSLYGLSPYPCLGAASNCQRNKGTQLEKWPSGSKTQDLISMEDKTHLEVQTTSFLWLFQLDDSKSLHKKWLFHQTSIKKWLFRVPGTQNWHSETVWKTNFSVKVCQAYVSYIFHDASILMHSQDDDVKSANIFGFTIHLRYQ